MGIIKPTNISTTNQLADIFTKALRKYQHWKLLAKLKVLNLHLPSTWGGGDAKADIPNYIQ